jgi:hypothetical protein
MHPFLREISIEKHAGEKEKVVILIKGTDKAGAIFN